MQRVVRPKMCSAWIGRNIQWISSIAAGGDSRQGRGDRPTAQYAEARAALRYEQFRFGFANAVSEDEAKQIYKEFAVPASGAPLFQAATANLNPWAEAKADVTEFIELPNRGHALTIDSGWREVADNALAFIMRFV